MAKVIITIEHDSDCENPADFDCQWKPYSFNTRHFNFLNFPDLWGNPSERLPLARKLKVGLAFYLSYYEHGNCLWFIKGEQPTGVEFQWDGTRFAGLLVWNHPPSEIGAKSYEERYKDASQFLENYTEWCNGNCWGYSIETVRGKYVDSCWGFLGSDSNYMLSQIYDALKGHTIEKIQGDGSWLWVPQKKKAA
jgi:hypothetical protein